MDISTATTQPARRAMPGDFVEYHGSLVEYHGVVFRVVDAYLRGSVPCYALRGQRVVLSDVRASSVTLAEW
jgi:hypothetical protein